MNWFGTNVQGVKPYQGITNAWQWLKDQWSDITGVTANQQSVADTNATNLQIAQDTNAQNYDVAMQNLGFQKDLQEYNQALQQQIFEREDTAYQRTAQDMRSAGLNPLSMQGTNGAGEAIAMAPMENQYQAQQSSPMQAYQRPNQVQEFVSLASSVLGSVFSLKDMGLKRDQLTLESDKFRYQKTADEIKNFLESYDKGYYFDSEGKMIIPDDEYFDERMKSILSEFKDTTRENQHKENAGIYDSDIREERIMTALYDWLVNGRGEEAWKALVKKYPILSIFTPYAKDIKPYEEWSEQEKKEWADEVNKPVSEKTNNYTTNRWTSGKTTGNW